MPSSSSDEVARCLLAENAINESASLIEGQTVGSNNAMVFLFQYKLFHFLKLKADFHRALLNECNLTKFVSFICNYEIFVIFYWLHIIQNTLHELLVWLVHPGVVNLVFDCAKDAWHCFNTFFCRFFDLEETHECLEKISE